MIRPIPLLVMIVVILALSVVAVGAMSARHNKARTPNRLGRKDVALLREMYSILVALRAVNDLVPLGLSTTLLKRINAAIDKYNDTTELPQ